MCATQLKQSAVSNVWGRPAQMELPPPLSGYKEREQNYYLSGGKIKEASNPAAPLYSPCLIDGKPLYIGSTPSLTAQESLEALNAASLAYDAGLGSWPQMSPLERIECLNKFTDQMITKRDQIAQLIMLEIAKPLNDCYKEFDRTVQYIKDTIDAYQHLLVEDYKIQDLGSGLKAQISRTPLGVTLCMGPFNYPLNETFTSLIPALIMGNTIVMKPARYGVLLFEPLLRSFQECFPPGVVNTIYGDGAKIIEPIMRSGQVDALAFIGSTKVAELVSSAHPAQHRLTKILGLGAHNPAVILPGADLEGIMPEIIKGSLTFNGQRCTTLALHYVHSSQAEDYCKLLADEIGKMKQGQPWEEDVSVTPLAEGVSKIDYLQNLIHDALDKGARIINQGGGTTHEGIMTPALLYPVTSDMFIYSQEQFGPIIPVVAYQDTDEVVRLISKSNLGQQLSVFGNDEAKLWEITKQSKNLVARVNINAQCQRGPDFLPFTGKKDSGLGVLSIRDALIAFSTPTVIAGKLGL